MGGPATSSVALVRTDLPFGRTATARFTEIVGLVDLVWAQTAGTIHRPVGRRIDIIAELALTTRTRGARPVTALDAGTTSSSSDAAAHVRTGRGRRDV